MLRELLHIGPVTIYGYGLMVAIGVISCVLVGMNRAKKLGVNPDILFNAAFIGIISAFIARAINGCTIATEPVLDAAGNEMFDEAGKKITQKIITESSGALSILTLIFAIIFMLIFMTLCRKVKALEKFESFAMPLAMFAAMACAVIFSKILPPSIADFTWYEVGKAVTGNG